MNDLIFFLAGIMCCLIIISAFSKTVKNFMDEMAGLFLCLTIMFSPIIGVCLLLFVLYYGFTYGFHDLIVMLSGYTIQ